MADLGGGAVAVSDGGIAQTNNLVMFKLYALVGVFCIALGGGLLPLRLQSYSFKERALSLGNSFAAGIFLSAGLVHMLAEAAESLTELLAPPWDDFPVAYCMCLCGMFLVIIVEQNVELGDGSHGHAHGVRRESNADVEEGGDNAAEVTPVAVGGAHNQAGHSHHLSLLEIIDEPSDGTGEGGAAATLVPYLLALMLSLHSLIEGMALGIEASIENMVMIFVAIMSHKSFAAFALGVSLSDSAVSRSRHIRTVALFASMTPIGIITGMAVAHLVAGAVHSALAALVTSLAAGTFIYVGLVEVLMKEMEKPTRNSNIIMAIVGAAAMSALAKVL